MTGDPVTGDLEDARDLPGGQRLFTRPVTFVKGVVALDGLPPMDRPEVAFAGRSNVGKSSLINALTNRRNLARASNTPGRTQEINYFDLDGAGYLVDLPGYGFAQAPKRAVERWTKLTRAFLRGRANLKRVYLLIDARHGVKTTDKEIMDALDVAAVSYHVTLTKIDKLRVGEAETRIAETEAAIIKRPAAFPRVAATSSAKDRGLDLLRAEIWETLSE